MRTEEGRRTPLAVHVENSTGDIDVALLRDLLHDQVDREQRQQVIGADRIHATGVQGRRRRRGQIGHDVVPLRRHLILGQHVLVLAY